MPFSIILSTCYHSLQIEHDNDRNGQCFVTQIYFRDNKEEVIRRSLEHHRLFKDDGDLYGEYGKLRKVELHEEEKKDKVIKKLCKEARKRGSRLCRRGVETRQVEFNIRLPSQWDWSRGRCGLPRGEGPGLRDKKCNCWCGDMKTRNFTGELQPGVGWLTQCPNRWAQAQLLFFGGVKKFLSAKSLFSQSLFYICQNCTQNRKYSKTTKKETRSPAPPQVTPML